MTYRERQRGQISAERAWDEIGLVGPTGSFKFRLGLVEDEMNIAPVGSDRLSYHPDLTLEALTGRQVELFAGTRSNQRLANVGGVYAIKHDDAVLCVEFSRLPSVNRQGGGVAQADYRIFVEAAASVPRDSDDLLEAIDQALDALADVEPAEGDYEFGIGHNAPPGESALSRDDYKAVEDSLRTLRGEVDRDQLTSELAQRVAKCLSEAASVIATWARKRLNWVEEGFYRGVGTLAATGMVGTGLWLVAGGKLERVSVLATKFAAHLIGVQ